MTISSEAKLTDMRIDPEFAEQLRVPLRPIWQVVHRDVLVELLGTYAELGDLADSDAYETVNRVYRLQREAESGTLGVLTKAKWEDGG